MHQDDMLGEGKVRKGGVGGKPTTPPPPPPKGQAVSEAQDMINHPSHYNFGSIEVIDAIDDWELEYHEGNVVKYVARAKHKGTRLSDLEKALWYLNRKVEILKRLQAKE